MDIRLAEKVTSMTLVTLRQHCSTEIGSGQMNAIIAMI
ncbi:MAG: hypothetical protein ACI9VI_003408 [Candidatus Azotimanducaceae bacterium]|jgi:hypothetical protein